MTDLSIKPPETPFRRVIHLLGLPPDWYRKRPAFKPFFFALLQRVRSPVVLALCPVCDFRHSYGERCTAEGLYQCRMF
jgi:hypothetical protein